MEIWVPDLEGLPASVLGWCAETTIIAAILAAVAWGCTRSRRLGLGPASLHTLWMIVLIRILMPPLVHWPLPVPWPVPRSADPASRVIELEPLFDEGALFTDSAIAEPEIDFQAEMIEPVDLSTFEVEDAEIASIDEEPGRTRMIDRLVLGMFGAWGIGSLAVLTLGLVRVALFRRRIKGTVPAPAWLIAEADRLASIFGVRTPSIWVVPGLASPLLWCLGRPRLLLPRHLVDSLDPEHWRGILVHELAHIRRGDPWVCRLELIAGILWWWNPLYRLVRHRIDAEAELACDAWVVALLPEERLVYAESLVEVCSGPSRSRSRASARIATPALGLGVAGPGAFLERRLLMILREHMPCRPSSSIVLAAGLLLVAATPAWTLARSAEEKDKDSDPPRGAAVTTVEGKPRLDPVVVEGSDSSQTFSAKSLKATGKPTVKIVEGTKGKPGGETVVTGEAVTLVVTGEAVTPPDVARAKTVKGTKSKAAEGQVDPVTVTEDDRPPAPPAPSSFQFHEDEDVAAEVAKFKAEAARLRKQGLSRPVISLGDELGKLQKLAEDARRQANQIEEQLAGIEKTSRDFQHDPAAKRLAIKLELLRKDADQYQLSYSRVLRIKDQMIMEDFRKRPEIADLIKEVKQKEKELDRVRKLARTRDDPALNRLLQEITELDKQYQQQWERHYEAICKQLVEEKNEIKQLEERLAEIKKKAKDFQHDPAAKYFVEELNRRRGDLLTLDPEMARREHRQRFGGSKFLDDRKALKIRGEIGITKAELDRVRSLAKSENDPAVKALEKRLTELEAQYRAQMDAFARAQAPKIAAKDKSRERRIQAIEATIQKLLQEVKQLREEGEQEDEEELR